MSKPNFRENIQLIFEYWWFNGVIHPFFYSAIMTSWHAPVQQLSFELELETEVRGLFCQFPSWGVTLECCCNDSRDITEAQKHNVSINVPFVKLPLKRSSKWPAVQIPWSPKKFYNFSLEADGIMPLSAKVLFFLFALFEKYSVHLPPRSAQKVISQPTPEANEVSMALTKFPKSETICISLWLVKRDYETRMFCIYISKLQWTIFHLKNNTKQKLTDLVVYIVSAIFYIVKAISRTTPQAKHVDITCP